ncbi:hypothetical protein DIT71_09260 [Marinobacter vulgaris]|uniref:Glycosyltransferase subfamily 4-like N-terminal domain-containing protein n=1 Tax=Marinobacter vulgaris TaxID=1928331 RepID=A0A2V3ZIN9_9GAMM|nr:glycosyltransferase family 4 protein [Marinobacter vulgaris]PXX90725.1 hypothetical protein DIT71_09260 [Marinobacter vulgaris]TSJ70303.1 glycosyltransferase family 4 protein [Marinobacter vulgaris]
MKILMTALQPGGGIRSFFRYIYGQPYFQDCSLTLVAPAEGLDQFIEDYLPPGRLTLIEAASGHVGFVRQVRALLKSGRFDFVHSHGFSAGVLTEIARAGLPVSHLMTAHDVFLASQFSGWKGSLKRRVMSSVFRRISAIHTVTDDARANLLEFFPEIQDERVHSILHGVDTEYFRDGETRNLKSELGLQPETPLIGFFGRFMGQKGFRTLVDAMQAIVEKRLVEPLPHVVTFGWGGFIREDYAYLEKEGLDHYFHQLPQTHNMPAAFKGVDLVAMPSRWEACGLLAMEALAAGVPMVGTHCVGLREVLEGTPASVVAPSDSGSLAKAIADDLKNLKTRKAEFIAFQEHAVECFQISRPASELRNLYQHVYDGKLM